MFEEFLQLLGDKVRLRGFDKYKGGLGERVRLHKIYASTLKSRLSFPTSQIPFTT